MVSLDSGLGLREAIAANICSTPKTIPPAINLAPADPNLWIKLKSNPSIWILCVFVAAVGAAVGAPPFIFFLIVFFLLFFILIYYFGF